MRLLFDRHPLLLATGLYFWFLYGAVITIWGDRAEWEYEWRENSVFSWFLRPRWPLDDPTCFASSQKVIACLILLVSSVVYVAFPLGQFGEWGLFSP